YRSAKELVKWMTILLVAHAVTCLVAVGSGWLEINLLERIGEGEYTDAEIEANDLRQSLIILVQAATLITLIVLFCLWTPRANRNARALGATGMQFTPRWCVIWYLIPIMNLFKPYQAMKEIWLASTPADATPWQQRVASPLLGWWWALWLVSGVAARASFRFSWRAESLDEYLTASRITLVSDAVDIPLAIVAMLLVRRIHAMQERSRYTTAFE
ncbi:MAG: DUF4328 domain-containing protein, partial [Planctomycetota bacterium]